MILNCVYLFTANGIRFLCKHYPLEFPPKEYLATAKFCELVGEFNAYANNRRRDMAMSADNEALTEERKGKLRKFREIYCLMKLHQSQKDSLKPSQVGVILCLETCFWIIDILFKDFGYKYFLTARINTDPVESHHGDVKSIHKNPTCLEYKRDMKIIAVTQYMAKISAAFSNYDREEGGIFLADLKTFHELQEEDYAENAQDFDIDLARAQFFEPPDFAQKAALAKFGGFILKISIYDNKNILKCVKCFTDLTIPKDNDEQEVNDLINMTEHKSGRLVRCSPLANEMFSECEKIFRSAWQKLPNQKGLDDKMTNVLLQAVSEKFPTVPLCHRKKIVHKFAKVRLFFYGRHIDKHFQKNNKRLLEGIANASKSSKA